MEDLPASERCVDTMSYEIKTGYIVYTTDGGIHRLWRYDTFYGPDELKAAEADANRPYRSMEEITFIEVDGVRFHLASRQPLRTKTEISLERQASEDRLAQAKRTLKESGFSDDDIIRLLANQ